LGDQRSGNGTGHVYNDTYGLYWSQCHADNAHSIGAKMIGINRLGTSAQYNITYVDLAFSLVNEYGGSSGSYDATSELMRLKATNDGGRVGIGTASPPVKFTVREGGDAKMAILAGQEYTDAYLYFGTQYNGDVNHAMKTAIIAEGISHWSKSKLHFCLDDSGNNSTSYNASLSNSRMTIQPNGNVGIGTTSPGAKLDVNGSTYLDYMETSSWIYIKGSTGSWPLPSTWGNKWNKNWSKTTTWVDGPKIALRIDSGSIYSQNDPVLHTNSDIRIKKDIEDVPDNLSLEMVRNIPCKYYKYIDEDRNIKNNDKKVIGFIAQEVKEVFPLAVDLVNDFEPNENRLLENISWEKITDSNNVCKYKLISDLQDVSGVKYKFYMINDPSGNVPETKKEIIGNNDNTFTFDNSWNYVFCVGREINDFHALDKSKLFTLNFSATQELDRKVIALENENSELKTKVASLESELATIKQHLGL